MSRHPKEMYFLAVIEMCQRFAFWGIGNLLVLYLVQFHQFSDPSATHLYGLFTGIAFVLPLLGGYIADRTSHKGAVMIGSLSTALGCFLMATGNLDMLYAALFFAAIGASVFTPSIYTILGAVYKDKHHLREGGFSIYYSAVNIGVFLATFILGALGHTNEWAWAFIIAGLVQFAGLFVFLRLMENPIFTKMHAAPTKQTAAKNSAPLKKEEKDRIVVICILSVVSILFWMAYNQGWSSMSLFSLRFTDRMIGGFEMPASWILSIESLYLIILAFPLAGLYMWLAKRKMDPSPPVKTVMSLAAMGLCFTIMMLGSRQIPAGAETAAISPFYPISAYFLMAVAEMLLAPIGLSLVTHLSPHRYTAFLVGVWYVCIGIAFYSGGWLAGLMSSMKDLSDFFNIFVLISFIPAVLLLLFVRKLNQMRHANRL